MDTYSDSDNGSNEFSKLSLSDRGYDTYSSVENGRFSSGWRQRDWDPYAMSVSGNDIGLYDIYPQSQDVNQHQPNDIYTPPYGDSESDINEAIALLSNPNYENNIKLVGELSTLCAKYGDYREAMETCKFCIKQVFDSITGESSDGKKIGLMAKKEEIYETIKEFYTAVGSVLSFDVDDIDIELVLKSEWNIVLTNIILSSHIRN